MYNESLKEALEKLAECAVEGLNLGIHRQHQTRIYNQPIETTETTKKLQSDRCSVKVVHVK